MRSVICTAPSMVVSVGIPSSSDAFAGSGAYAEIKAAAAVLPVVERNWRRVGLCGFALCWSDIKPPFAKNKSLLSLGQITVRRYYFSDRLSSSHSEGPADQSQSPG